MTAATVLGWQPALACVLDEVVEAMNVTHDVLILRSGRRRASAVIWEIYGPELAGVLARTRGGGSARGPNVSGTFTQGLARIAFLEVGSEAGGTTSPSLTKGSGVSAVTSPWLRARAEGFPQPTMVMRLVSGICRSTSPPTRSATFNSTCTGGPARSSPATSWSRPGPTRPSTSTSPIMSPAPRPKPTADHTSTTRRSSTQEVGWPSGEHAE